MFLREHDKCSLLENPDNLHYSLPEVVKMSKHLQVMPSVDVHSLSLSPLLLHCKGHDKGSLLSVVHESGEHDGLLSSSSSSSSEGLLLGPGVTLGYGTLTKAWGAELQCQRGSAPHSRPSLQNNTNTRLTCFKNTPCLYHLFYIYPVFPPIGVPCFYHLFHLHSCSLLLQILASITYHRHIAVLYHCW